MDRGQVHAFVQLERDFLSDYPLFWSQPDTDIACQLLTQSGESTSARRLFVAKDRDVSLARCAAVLPSPHHPSRTSRTGFIGNFAARADALDAAVDMLRTAECWLARGGAQRVVAPHNGSPGFDQAVLTAAFDESPMFPLPWNPPYYRAYFEAAGYRATYPLLIYEIDLDSHQFQTASNDLLHAPRFGTRLIDTSRWAAELNILLELFNECLNEDCSVGEFRSVLGPIEEIDFDPRLIQFMLDDDRPIGFIVGTLDLVPALRQFRGQLGPAQLGKLKRTGPSNVDRAGAFAGALLPAYRGRGLASMAAQYFVDLAEMGFATALYYPVNAANTPSRRLAESLGGHGRLLYHCFDKNL